MSKKSGKSKKAVETKKTGSKNSCDCACGCFPPLKTK
ncbi:hypothetical protein MNBD_NITROSPINAE04-2499 [hydrothermal vent metagenome]|uniref:Uncharacterized protein n=1 Tax=hydrothermal vent metagenome TaxID=652676 RepID=A0A3B1BWG1_9ZZZZ